MPYARLLLAAIVMASMLTGSRSVSARQATPETGAPTIEPLLEVTLPIDTLPDGPLIVSLAHWSWEPDAAATVPTGVWQVGIVIDRVLSGSYTAASGGNVRIVSGSTAGSSQDVVPDTEFVVEEGFGAVYLQNEASWKFLNGGTTNGTALGGGILSTAPPTEAGMEIEQGITYVELAAVDIEQLKPSAAEAYTFRYWQSTLAAGQSILAADAAAIQLVGADPASPAGTKLTVADDGSARNDGDDTITVFGLTLSPAS